MTTFKLSLRGSGVILAAALAALMSAGTAYVVSAQSVEVAMEPQSGSGHSGMATLVDEGAQTRVILLLDNPVPGPEPAHIHVGSCPTPNPVPTYPLNNVENGRSETVLMVKLGALISEPMAINVHRSPQDLATYVSCGDIMVDEDFTAETAIDSVRENARENTSDELKRDSDNERRKRN